MYLAFFWGEAAFAAATKVIVVGTNDDRFVLEFGIRAFENTNNVVSRNFAPKNVNSDTELRVARGKAEQHCFIDWICHALTGLRSLGRRRFFSVVRDLSVIAECASCGTEHAKSDLTRNDRHGNPCFARVVVT